jgi:hypothetical protein
MTRVPTAIVVVATLVALELVVLTPDSVTGLPKFTPSTLNCTVPVGAPDAAARETVAVNVTD